MIRLMNIHKAFGKNKVLNGINLTVKKGDVVAILGPSSQRMYERGSVTYVNLI